MKTIINNLRGLRASVSHKWAQLLGSLILFHLATARAQAADMFQKPTGDGTRLWDSLLLALQYIFFALYILGTVWIVQAWNDWKEGDKKSAFQKLGGALGIFLSPALIQIIRYIARQAGGADFN